MEVAIPPATRKDALRKRVSRVFSTLLHPPMKGKGKQIGPQIPRNHLVNLVTTAIGSKAQDELKALRRYVSAKDVPQAKRAWYIGESLRTLGVQWCSGLWMLWLCGHYDDAIATVATWMRSLPEPDRPAAAAEIWDMFSWASDLWLPTPLDGTAPFAAHYIKKSELDDETMADLDAWKATAKASGADTEACSDFIAREAAKTAWLPYEAHAAGMQTAFENRSHAYQERSELDRLVVAMLAIANARQPVDAVEMALLMMLGGWINSVEAGDEGVRYPRDVELA